MPRQSANRRPVSQRTKEGRLESIRKLAVVLRRQVDRLPTGITMQEFERMLRQGGTAADAFLYFASTMKGTRARYNARLLQGQLVAGQTSRLLTNCVRDAYAAYGMSNRMKNPTFD